MMTTATPNLDQVQTKTVEAGEFKVLDDQQGVVEAIVSVTGVVDHVNDVIIPGAYKDTLNGRQPKVCWGHDWKNPVGKVLAIEEMMPGDARLPPALLAQRAGAVKARVQFNLATQRGREAYEDVKFWGPEGEWSIGYDTQSKAGGVIKHNKQTGVREIHKLALYEVSPVIFGAAPGTGTTSIKWLSGEIKREFSTEEREKLAGTGAAMPGGGYPIKTTGDLRNAIQAFGRAKDPAATKRHIIKRARALGATDMLPEDWKADDSILEYLEMKRGPAAGSAAAHIRAIHAAATRRARRGGRAAPSTAERRRRAARRAQAPRQAPAGPSEAANREAWADFTSVHGGPATPGVSTPKGTPVKPSRQKLPEGVSATKPGGKLTKEERGKLADIGWALPDGSYPIRNRHDLSLSMSMAHYSKNPAAVRALIQKRAADLRVKLPEKWQGPGAKSMEGGVETKRDFSTAKRETAADSGAALPDGSFPIYTRADLRNAMRLVGKAKDVARARAHIIKRANALGFSDMLGPDYKSGVYAVRVGRPAPEVKAAIQRDDDMESALADYFDLVT